LKKERAVSEGSLGLALVVGLQEADWGEVILARLRRNRRCMARRAARAEPRCRQLAAGSSCSPRPR